MRAQLPCYVRVSYAVRDMPRHVWFFVREYVHLQPGFGQLMRRRVLELWHGVLLILHCQKSNAQGSRWWPLLPCFHGSGVS